jgi:SAM-dependent methyltransferase
MSEKNLIREQVQKFYNQRPYPPPVKNLDNYRQRWQDVGRQRAEFHLHWPHKPYQESLSILVAGCGTSQAARHALRNPKDRVVGIDLSPTCIRHTEKLKRKYRLDNLEVRQLPVEHAPELEGPFDKIICTGVLHHLPDPDEGLRALRDVLKPEGTMYLMVYAAYGRHGVNMLQKYARLLKVGVTDAEITDFANTLMALPLNHPLAELLGDSPDFRTKAGLADALLNPLDRAYTIPQLFEWIAGAGLRFKRWVRQAPYLPQCGAFAETPHVNRLTALPDPEQFAAMELLRGTMVRHSLIIYRDDTPENPIPAFDGDDWLNYVPIRLPETICVEERLPPGATGVLINQNHTDNDLYLPINAAEKQQYEAIDGKLTIHEIIKKSGTNLESAHIFFEHLWWFDQVVFDIFGR